jgi:hypothetical protein
MPNGWTQNVVDIARYATCIDSGDADSAGKKQRFRKRAHKRDNVFAELDNELKGDGKGKFRRPTADEAYFINGWMRDHEQYYLDAAGNLDDAALVQTIRAHVVCPGDDGVHTMTG